MPLLTYDGAIVSTSRTHPAEPFSPTLILSILQGDASESRGELSGGMNTLSLLGLQKKFSALLESTLAQYKRAISADPKDGRARNDLGVILHLLGRFKESEECFRLALSTDSYSAPIHNNIGIALKSLGAPLEALRHHQASIRLTSGNPASYASLVECLCDMQLSQISDDLRTDVLEALLLPSIDQQQLAFAIASLVAHSSGFQRLSRLLDSESTPSLEQLIVNGLSEMSSDALMLLAPKKLILRHRSLEFTLTRLRRELLRIIATQGLRPGISQSILPFTFSLAHQCFLNEYVYFVSRDELLLLKCMRDILESSLDRMDERIKPMLGLFACYEPLYHLDRSELLLGATSDHDLASLVKQQVLEPTTEKQLRSTIESVDRIDNVVSQVVRNQYEESPYPRWISSHKCEEQRVVKALRGLIPHALSENIDNHEFSPRILVAGCGTGQQAIDRAIEFPNSEILGIDISLSSLSYGKRKALELGLHNVEFKHLDLLNLHQLNKRFDIVECIGVLHHMADPVQGWRILADVLMPGALMRVGVYSELARRNIATAQAWVSQQEYPATPDGIRRCRRDIVSMDDPVMRAVTDITDFYTMSEARDLLFHVHEYRYTLRHIEEILKACDLEFLGFEDGGTSRAEDYRLKFQQDETGTSLQNWTQYEQSNKHTFIGMYLFWVRKRASLDSCQDRD
jgi:ubiquinone/menaquinone biosynthesis C-methylase UbiE/tetratricopeptide (TPR) repeat protein